MSTKLYVCNRTPVYTPATKRGAWDLSSSVTVGALDTSKIGGGIITSVNVAETSSSNTYDVALSRFISGRLAAQTIGGTFDVTICATESNAAADMYFHVYIYVTQGDSDVVRGVLLNDYVENTTNEFGTSGTTGGKSLQSPQSLSSLSVNDGDRIVVEMGYIARNSVTTSYAGYIRYGTLLSSNILDVAPDLTVGGDTTTQAGFFTFSQDLLWLSEVRSYEEFVEVGSSPNQEVRFSEQFVEVGAAKVLPEVRLSDFWIEYARFSIAENAYVDEMSIEVVSSPPSEARVSEQWFDVVRQNITVAAVGEMWIDVVSSNVSTSGSRHRSGGMTPVLMA